MHRPRRNRQTTSHFIPMAARFVQRAIRRPTHAYTGGVLALGLAALLTFGSMSSPATARTMGANATPLTSTTIAGALGRNGWYSSSSVIITLVAHRSGNTPVLTFYRVRPSAGYVYYTRPFAVKGNGKHVVDYYSIQGSARESVHSTTIAIDTTPPTTAGAVLGSAPSKTAWYNHPVMLGLIGADTGSGVAATYWQRYGQAFFTRYSAPISISGRGRNIIVFYSVDQAGNREALHQLTVNIDRQAPTTLSFVNNAPLLVGAYVGHVTLTLRASDDLSGVSAIYLTVDGKRHVYSGPLTISRTGAHVITYYAVDIAGNDEAVHRLVIPIVVRAPVVPPTRLPTSTPIPLPSPTMSPAVAPAPTNVPGAAPTHTPIPVPAQALRITLAAGSKSVAWGRTVRLTAHVTPAVPGAVVELRQSTNPSSPRWRVIRHDVLGASGTMSWTLHSDASASYDVLIAGALLSTPVTVHTYSVVTLQRVQSSLAGNIILAGRAWPPVAGHAVVLQRLGQNRSWKTVATAALQSDGRYIFITPWDARSTAYWRVWNSAQATIAGSYSNVVTTKPVHK